MEILSKLKQGKPKYYFRFLAAIFMKFVKEEDVPKKYKIAVELTDKGIIVKILGTKYMRAIAPSGLPSFDRHACKILATCLGNTIAKLEGYAPTTEGGIVLPDEEHLAQYG